MQSEILQTINSSVSVKEKILNDSQLIKSLEMAVELIVECYRAGGKVLFCGNGGSAADAQHLAAELSGRFYFDRPPLQAEAMHVNSSFVTAVANDYGFDFVFARMIEAWGKKGDILVALSTSGNSKNIISAVNSAISKQMRVIGFTGASGGKINDICHLMIRVPSKDTPRIQESHILLGHIICEHVEKILFPR
jgi:D-sedoheptulose 7-phosphate isomerase